MDCAGEVGILKRELRDLVGNGSNLSFDILNGRMRLRDDGRLSTQQVIERVARTHDWDTDRVAPQFGMMFLPARR